MDIAAVLLAVMQSQIWYPLYKRLFTLNIFNLKPQDAL